MAIDVNKKLAGVLIPVFALRRQGDLGIGDTLAMKDAIDFCAKNGVAVLQTLPINETSGDNSPYNAISSVSLEHCLLAMVPDMVPGLTQEHLDKEIAGSDLASGPDRPALINYPVVKDLKLGLLRRAFESCTRGAESGLKSEFEQFKQHHKQWLHPYALFRTLMEYHGGNPRWTDWQPQLRSVQGAESWIASSSERKKLEEAQNFWSYVQWVAYRQWSNVKKHADENNVRLMGDIPFGVSRYSGDVWAHQELFDLSWSGGAPAEPVFAGDPFTKKWGQNWGIPLYDWQAHKRQDFKWWKQRVLRLLDHFHDYRIDHVLGFFRVYSFPWLPEKNEEFLLMSEDEAEERAGGRVPQFLPRPDEPEENAEKNCREGAEILRILSDTARDCNIIAEDLGLVVPEYLRPAIHELGIAGFAIPIFERVEGTREFKPMSKLHPLSLATYATHDHQPIRSYYNGLVEWWHGEDGSNGWQEVQRLMRLLKLDDANPPTEFTDELHEVFMKRLLESHCRLSVFMITDLLATTQRFNQPGLSGEACWTERLHMDLSQYEADPLFKERIKRFAKAIRSTNRLPEVRTVLSGG